MTTGFDIDEDGVITERADDGGAAIEYCATDRYFVVLYLEGVEIARRGPYRDKGAELVNRVLERAERQRRRLGGTHVRSVRRRSHDVRSGVRE